MNATLNFVVFATLFLFSGNLARILDQDDCNCNPDGSMTNSTKGCDAKGQCHCKCAIGGLKCDECLDFHFGFPNCEDNYCSCNVTGSTSLVCNKTSGQCSCRTNVSGKKCQVCQNGFKNHPNCTSCDCNTDGSNGIGCSNEGQCICKEHIGGMQCHHCKDKYFGFPSCKLCQCDEEGSLHNICDKSTGRCSCISNVEGDVCDRCKDNHYDFPSCKRCPCNSKGSKNDKCNVDTGDCDCIPHVTGQKCDKCQFGYFDFPNCKDCQCFAFGTMPNTTCSDDGKCLSCKPGYSGTKCEECANGYFRQSDGCCQACNCTLAGSKNKTCNDKGECICKNKLITGAKCDKCVAQFFNFPNCQACGCNEQGVEKDDLTCGDKDGKCNCKCNVRGDKCNECEVGHYGFPKCTEKPDFRLGATKVLIVTGGPQQTDIIDIKDPSFNCTKPKQFPVSWSHAVGGLVGQVPFVCERVSNGCYALQQSGSWQKDRYATGERWAATGSLVINDKLVIAGGWRSQGSTTLTSIQAASPNTRTKTLSVRLPVARYSACMVPWDADTFLMIGGGDSTWKSMKNTYYVNMNTNRVTNGPTLLTARRFHACNEIIVNGESFIIVAGGSGSGAGTSTEYLSKSSTGNRWKAGPNLPTSLSGNSMVLSTDKRSLYTLGGGGKNIFQFSCSGGITTCKWTKNAVQLKNSRSNAVVFTIPDALAYKLCN